MDCDSLMMFRKMFEAEKAKILVNHKLVDDGLHLQKDDMLDEVDMTSSEMDTTMRLRLRNRETLFVRKIDEALKRISEGTYGSCEGCGEDIESGRLQARPTTTMCVACKEESERREWLHIDGHRHKSLGTRLKLA